MGLGLGAVPVGLGRAAIENCIKYGYGYRSASLLPWPNGNSRSQTTTDTRTGVTLTDTSPHRITTQQHSRPRLQVTPPACSGASLTTKVSLSLRAAHPCRRDTASAWTRAMGGLEGAAAQLLIMGLPHAVACSKAVLPCAHFLSCLANCAMPVHACDLHSRWSAYTRNTSSHCGHCD